MGFGITDILYFKFLKIDWKAVRNICDLGLQEIHCEAGYDYIEDFMRSCGSIGDMDEEKARSLFRTGYMGDFWDKCGKSYIALDVVGDRDFCFFDLNFDDVLLEWKGKFDLVCNAGTTEHILNQYRGFKTIHDLTKVGGYMYHALPLSGFHNHGLINYNMKFFYTLTKANRYEWIDSFLSLGKVNEGLERGVCSQLDQDKDFLPVEKRSLKSLKRDFKSIDAGIRVVLKKKKDTPFRAGADLGQGARRFTVKPEGRLARSK